MQNFPTGYRDTGSRVPDNAPQADWDDGMNGTASCAPGIGIATAVQGPYFYTWSHRAPPRVEDSQQIGLSPSGLEVLDPNYPKAGILALVASGSDTPPDEVVATVEGFDFINRSGKTLPGGPRLWCTAENP